MSVPQPPIALEGHCSAIDDDTLYVLSPNALQSISLKQNATWSQEPNGQSVTGAACAKAAPNADGTGAALFVIGGTSQNGSYNGLQRYFFGNKSWESLLPLAADNLQGRTNHSAVYLNDSESILIYAGSQPQAPSLYSSQTFLISTQPPYNIRSFTSEAPPLTNPVLEPWNSSHAVMVGGSDSNIDVWTFGPDAGWQQFPISLSEPLDPDSRATMVDGGDGSKVLQVYDLSTSPNSASGIVLVGANGQAAKMGETVGTSGPTSRKRKRDLTIDNWPSYNSSNAPTATRTDSSLAENSNGVVVIAGGNGDSPLALFDQKDNSWVDAGKFFNGKEQKPLQPTTPSSTTASGSPTSSTAPASSGAAGSGGNNSHQKMLRTLGITLGVLFGIAAIFILVLLLLRWRKTRARRKDGYLEEKADADRMSFADRGASFMKEAGVSTNNLSPPSQDRYANANDSHSSLAIIAGRFGNKRNTNGHKQQSSFESTARLVKDRQRKSNSDTVEMMDIGDKRSTASKGSTMSRPGSIPAVPEIEPMSVLDPDTRADRSRSSGWSKYFATSQPTGPNGLSHIPSVYVQPNNSLSVDSAYGTDQRRSQMSRIPSSVLVPPLEIDFSKTIDGQRLSHVASGSPAFSDSRADADNGGHGNQFAQGQKGLIVDPSDLRASQSLSISSYGNRSTMSSTMTGQFYDAGRAPWTPVNTFKDHVIERPSSSVYTDSVYDRKLSRGGGQSSSFFPGAGTSYKAPKVKMSHSASPTADWAAPKEPPLAKIAADRDSTVTVFPRGVPSAYYVGSKGTEELDQEPGAHPPKPINTDMSWLNLDLTKNQI